MSVIDYVVLFIGVDAEKAVVKKEGKPFLTLYKEGYYGKESLYKESEYHTHNLGEWINSADFGLECQFAGEDYSHPENCKAFIGLTVGELSSSDGIAYMEVVNEEKILENKESIKNKLIEIFDIHDDPKIYLLRHVE
ncbi:MAG: hypothetical protein AB1798_13800 [Spirochaetota bacterium]